MSKVNEIIDYDEENDDRTGGFTHEPASHLCDTMMRQAAAFVELMDFECAVVRTTNVRLELTFEDCIKYDLPGKWLGNEATFANFVIFDGFYAMPADSDSFLEFEFMSAVNDELEAVLGVRDLSDHGDFAKRGITVEIDAADEDRYVVDELFEEFQAELQFLDNPEDTITDMMDFNMQVLQGGAFNIIWRYFAEFEDLEALR